MDGDPGAGYTPAGSLTVLLLLLSVSVFSKSRPSSPKFASTHLYWLGFRSENRNHWTNFRQEEAEHREPETYKDQAGLMDVPQTSEFRNMLAKLQPRIKRSQHNCPLTTRYPDAGTSLLCNPACQIKTAKAKDEWSLPHCCLSNLE